ncbi:CitMHS family transporter [Pectinatus cerevisiiphilus]|uniref:CitMHS family citrate-Mg2+:H+ or citrate-Ca2+:H+ symporter n=1 Tax=Pectinatus cerevisiiphilus TaxID=86956 RepID=A0A4R3K608_9FIRM|nr:citrate:proton symporter [Pectinatus cerevisiiphilus]TCS78223.1 CitMHS family citrate-Mg2+:H+ or citrate-Ca2+:H+ symporter [Pectinatus cerevisiiphilus]
MLAFWGLLIIVIFMYLILSKRFSAFVALILVPVVIGCIAGFSTQIGKMMMDGVKTTAPTAVLMMMAVLFFSILTDAGLFEPVIRKIILLVHGDPLKIAIGTALLALVASLEGEGAVTVIITCTPFLPLYKKMNMNVNTLAVLTWMPVVVKGFFPWAGPSARTVTALGINSTDLFAPVVWCMLAGIIWTFLTAYIIGLRERKRIGLIQIDTALINDVLASVDNQKSLYRRPKLIFINLLLMLIAMIAILKNILPTTVIFELGAAIALIVNFHSLKEQSLVLFNHAKGILTVGIMIVAAGVFVGILTGTKMIDAIAEMLISFIPSTMGPHIGFITAVLSAPLSFSLSPDGFFFGVLPILAKLANAYGISNLQVGIAGLMGMAFQIIGPTVGALWLLIGVCETNLGDFHKAAVIPFTGLTLLFIIVELIVGGFPM